MPLQYADPRLEGPLFQGEILGDVWEYRLEHPAVEQGTSPPPFRSIHHSRVIVLTAACDLEQDFRARNGAANDSDESPAELEEPAAYVPYVLICPLVEQQEIEVRPGIHSKIWTWIRTNQHGRYHRLAEAPIGGLETAARLPDLFLDFKRTLALPTESIYAGLKSGGVKRIAVVPPIYIHHLIQRYYSFLSRVGT